jgi:hypothetical protein
MFDHVRSLILTNCDTHNNWPPEAFKPFLAQAAAGKWADEPKSRRSRCARGERK